MFYNRNLSAQQQKAVAARVEEAAGLLSLITRLCKKAGKLTLAEQEVFTETVGQANGVLRAAMEVLYEESLARHAAAAEVDVAARPNGAAVRKS